MQRAEVRALASSAVATLLVACSGSDGTGPAQPTTGTIEGRVTAAGSGVEGATVARSGDGTQTTDANGAYRFSNVSPGAYTLGVSMPAGFALSANEPAEKQVTVQAGQTATVNWSAEVDANGETPLEEIELRNVSFEPDDVEITVGTRVRWTYQSGEPHTVTPDEPGQPGGWASQNLGPGSQPFDHTFNTPGEYTYHCVPHRAQGMTGRIVVREAED
jgi:plastocyanin